MLWYRPAGLAVALSSSASSRWPSPPAGAGSLCGQADSASQLPAGPRGLHGPVSHRAWAAVRGRSFPVAEVLLPAGGLWEPLHRGGLCWLCLGLSPDPCFWPALQVSLARLFLQGLLWLGEATGGIWWL